jgi:hypothetical protein
MISVYVLRSSMGTTVRKTISLPAGLAREAEAVARAEGKTFATVVGAALRQFCAQRRDRELGSIQGYWSRLARQRGILSERDLKRYLRT